MHFNPIAIPTLICSAAFFWLGVVLERKTTSVGMRRCLFLAGLALAIPGSLFVLYYTHLFDSAAWFYNFRALPLSELAVSGIGVPFRKTISRDSFSVPSFISQAKPF